MTVAIQDKVKVGLRKKNSLFSPFKTHLCKVSFKLGQEKGCDRLGADDCCCDQFFFSKGGEGEVRLDIARGLRGGCNDCCSA